MQAFDYELDGYRESRLVKLDIMLNGDVVDALSFILHEDKAYPRARKMAEKLKEKNSAPAFLRCRFKPVWAARSLPGRR